MGELATAREDIDRYVKDEFKLTGVEMIDRIDGVIVDLEKDKSLYPKDWVIPGGTVVSAALDLARTTCRRAERRVAVFVANAKDFNTEILRYLNRRSDLCWVFWLSMELWLCRLRGGVLGWPMVCPMCHLSHIDLSVTQFAVT